MKLAAVQRQSTNATYIQTHKVDYHRVNINSCLTVVSLVCPKMVKLTVKLSHS